MGLTGVGSGVSPTKNGGSWMYVLASFHGYSSLPPLAIAFHSALPWNTVA